MRQLQRFHGLRLGHLGQAHTQGAHRQRPSPRLSCPRSWLSRFVGLGLLIGLSAAVFASPAVALGARAPVSQVAGTQTGASARQDTLRQEASGQQASGDLTKTTSESAGLFNAAIKLYQRNLFEEAAAEWEGFLKKYPRDELASRAWYYQGLAYQRADLPSKAVGSFEQVLRDFPNFERREDAYYYLASVRFTLTQQASEGQKPALLAKTAEDCARLLDAFPQSKRVPRMLFVRGECLYALGKKAEAANAYGRLVTDYPQDQLAKNALYAQGVALQENDRPDLAAEAYKDFLKRFGRDALAPEVQWRLAELYYSVDKFAEAVELYTTAAKSRSFPLRDSALMRAADCHYRQKDYARAARNFAELIQNFPQSKEVPQAWLALGRCQYLMQQYKTARRNLDHVLQGGGPGAPEAGHLIARCHLKENQASEALAVAEKALSLPEAGKSKLKAQLQLDRADALYELPGRRADALQGYLSVYKANPQRDLAHEALYLAALCALEERQYQQARDFSGEYVQRFPDESYEPDVRYIDAESRLLTKDYAGARAAYQGLKSKFPDHPLAARIPLREGLALFFLKKYPQSIEVLGKLLQTKPDKASQAEAYYWIGRSQAELKQYDQAAEALLASVQTQPDWRRADQTYLILGHTYEKADKTKQAITAWQTLLQRFPQSKHCPEALYRLGETFYRLRNLDQAITYYRTLLQKFPTSEYTAYSAHGLGWAYLGQQQYPQAEAQFSTAIAKVGDDPLADQAYFARGLVRRQLKKYPQAEQDLLLFLESQPQEPELSEARYELALAQVGQRQLPEAIRTLQKVLRANPSYQAADKVYYELGWALRGNNQEAEAVQAFTTLSKKFPESPLAGEAFFHLAEAAYAEKDYPAAVRAYQQAVAKAAPDIQEKAAYKWAWAEYQQQKHQQAAERFAELIKEFPQGGFSSDASLMQGESLFKLEKFAPALAAYQKALAGYQQQGAKPNPVYYQLALLRTAQANGQLEKPDWELSLDTLAQMEKLFPKSDYQGEMLYEKAWALQNTGQSDQASKLYLQVPEVTKNAVAARAYFMHGELRFAAGNHKEAIRSFFKAAYKYQYPQWGAASLFEAGRCFEVLKNVPEAKKVYEEIIRDYGNKPQAAEDVDRARKRLAELSQT